MNSLESNKVPQRLVVDRRYWGRGSKGGKLSHSDMESDANMCILGLYLHHVVKIPLSQLNGNAAPSGVFYGLSKRDKRATLDLVADAGACWLISGNDRIEDRDVVAEIYRINDETYLSDDIRERRIVECFARFNVQVEFIN